MISINAWSYYIEETEREMSTYRIDRAVIKFLKVGIDKIMIIYTKNNINYKN